MLPYSKDNQGAPSYPTEKTAETTLVQVKISQSKKLSVQKSF